MPQVVRHVMIRGRVQGVGYRAWVADTAAKMSVEGWVRNRRDGAVEAVLSGSQDVVDAVIALCRRGPSLALVDDLHQQAGHPDELKQRQGGEPFSVLPTV